MIILKILLYIILAVLGIAVLLCIIPVKVEISYIGEKIEYSIKYAFILLADSGSKTSWLIEKLKNFRRRKRPENDSKDDDKSGDETDFQYHDEYCEPMDDIPEDIPVYDEETDEIRQETVKPEQTEHIEEVPQEDVIIDVHEQEDPEEPDEDEDDDGISGKISKLINLWNMADRPVLKILKGVHIYDLYIDFIIADEDAYNCAMKYGAISGTVYNLLAWLSVMFTVRLQTIDVNAGFGLDENRWDAAAKVSFQLGTLVIAGVWFLITYIFKYFIPNKLNNKKK